MLICRNCGKEIEKDPDRNYDMYGYLHKNESLGFKKWICNHRKQISGSLTRDDVAMPLLLKDYLEEAVKI